MATGLVGNIQAFPLVASAFQGTASAFKCKNYRILKMMADGDVTIKYTSGGSVTFTGLKAGLDFSIPNNAEEVTSTVAVMIA